MSGTTGQTLWQLLVMMVALALALLYHQGWRRMQRIQPGLATRQRLAAFLLADLFVAAALASPLAAWSVWFLLARTGQTVLLSMLAPPLFWLAVPVHLLSWGLPGRLRRWVTAGVIRPSPVQKLLHPLAQAGVVWLIFVSVLVIWHDPLLVDATMSRPWARTLLPLFLHGAAMLFWAQIIGLGPRRLPQAPIWGRFVLLLGVEIPNMVAGITIAFSASPLYGYYAAARVLQPQLYVHGLGAMNDQTISGGVTWVFGSLVYISSAVLILNQLFKSEGIGQAQPLANWDADARFIAPGLESRLEERGRESHDWKKH